MSTPFSLSGFDGVFEFLPSKFECFNCGLERHALTFNNDPFPTGSKKIFRDDQVVELPDDTPVACIYCAIWNACLHRRDFCNNCIGYGQFYEEQFFPCINCCDVPAELNFEDRKCLNCNCDGYNKEESDAADEEVHPSQVEEDESESEIDEQQVRADMIEYLEGLEQ